MRTKKLNKLFLYPLGGFVTGWIMTLPFWFSAVGAKIGNSWIGIVWEYANIPARFMASVAGSGGSEWAAWFLIPVIGVIVQWTLVGLLIGLFCSRRTAEHQE